jgi:hypothetical protein
MITFSGEQVVSLAKDNKTVVHTVVRVKFDFPIHSDQHAVKEMALYQWPVWPGFRRLESQVNRLDDPGVCVWNAMDVEP